MKYFIKEFFILSFTPFLLTAGLFGIYFSLISYHNLSDCRHHREGSDWNFDNQEQLSEAAYLCSLSGSHRQSETRGFLIILQLCRPNLGTGTGCVVCVHQLLFEQHCCVPVAADSTGGHKRGHPWKLWSTAGGSDHPPCVVWLPWSDAGHEGHCLDRDVVILNLVVQNDYSLWWTPHVLLQGPGTNDDVLIEIFASRSNAQTSALNEAYLQGELRKKVFVNCLFVVWIHFPACFCHREGEEVDLWPEEGTLWRLFQSSAPPRWGL